MTSSLKRLAGGWLWAAVLAWGLCLSLQTSTLAADSSEPIDWNRARQLFQKSQQGETLSDEDRAYLERARAERRKQAKNGDVQNPEGGSPAAEMQRARQLLQKQQKGESLTDEEKAFLQQAQARRGKGQAGAAAPPPPRESTGLIPLDELAGNYNGQDGGLYGQGRNQPPALHLQAALAEAAKITPLDEAGKPSPKGKIVMISIGMSNTTMEYSKFKPLADADPAKSPQVVIVDCAQGGQDAALWSSPDANTWRVLAERLKAAGVTPQQVQVVWMKHARIAPSRFGDFPKHTEELEGHIVSSLQIARQRFPNLRLAYLSSRIYAGYATTGLNPEPYSYESGFAVRDLILRQIKGEAALNCDVAKGEIKAPLLLWGPYLWCDGLKPRKSDGLIWKREDCGPDGTHPSPTTGREKVAEMLLRFLKTDATAKNWFLARP